MRRWRGEVDGARWGIDLNSAGDKWLRIWPDPLLYLDAWMLGIDADKTMYGPGEKPRRVFRCGR